MVEPEQAPPVHMPVAQDQGLPHCPFDPHVSTSALPEHCCEPGVQTETLASCMAEVVQAPLTHDWLDGHTLPHPPQLFGSVCSFTQVPLQMVNPVGQVVVAVASDSTVASSDGPPPSTI
jgi:hypothetical protein